MRLYLSLLFTLTFTITKSQLTSDFPVLVGDVTSITEQKFTLSQSVLVQPNGAKQIIGSPSRTKTFTTTTQYEKGNIPSRVNITMKGFPYISTVLKYDTVNRVISTHIQEINHINEKQKQRKFLTTSVFNDNEQLIEYRKESIETADSLSFVRIENKAKYDSNGLTEYQIYEIEQNTDTTTAIKVNITYDLLGRPSLRTETSIQPITLLVLDSTTSGDILIEASFPEPVIIRQFKYRYDSNGILHATDVSILPEKRNAKIHDEIQYFYVYDKHGNWVKREKKTDSSTFLETKRKIRYRK